MSPSCRVLALLTVLSSLPAVGADEVADRLRGAIASHQERFDRASKRLSDHLGQAVKETVMAGDLDAATQLRDEKEAFDEDGELPTSGASEKARSAYEKELEEIEDAIIKALDDAAGDRAEAREIEAALLVRTAKDELLEAERVPSRRRGIFARIGPDAIDFAKARRAFRNQVGEARERLPKTLDERYRAEAARRDVDSAVAIMRLSEQVRKADDLPASALWRTRLAEPADRFHASLDEVLGRYQDAGRRAVRALRASRDDEAATEMEREALRSPSWPALTSMPRLDFDPKKVVDVEPSSRQHPDYIRDIAPRGGVLVGFRFTYKKFFDKDLIESIRPIYQVGPWLREGSTHGNALGRPDLILAKPGYAVSGVTTRTGLMLDGFRLTFRKVKTTGLDPDDRYESPDIGYTEGARPLQSPSSPIKPIVGIQGRVHNGTIHTLGLVAAP